MVIVNTEPIVIRTTLSKDQLEAAYVMWSLGARADDIAVGLDISPAMLAWLCLTRGAGKLDDYIVHYGVTN
jgi:hypothetical protein